MTAIGAFAIGALVIVVACAASAQSPEPAAETGSISGTVVNADSKLPVPEAIVSAVTVATPSAAGGLTGDSRQGKAVTDIKGRYAITELPQGHYLVFTQTRGRSYSKTITLSDGQEHASADFEMLGSRTISGRVLDDGGEPVHPAEVSLVTREYQMGILRWVIKDRGATDDRGEYRLEHAEPGQTYVIKASPRDRVLDAISNSPLKPKARAAALVVTYYPNSIDIEGAVPIVAGPGALDHIDIRMPRLPAYCMDGTLQAQGVPAALHFFIEENLQTGAGGFIPPGGTAGADGKIRICDLRPGVYRLTAVRFSKDNAARDVLFGVGLVSIGDDDVHDVRVSAVPGLPVSIQVAWDGAPPERGINSTVALQIWPLNRAHLVGETLTASCAIPGNCLLPGLLLDTYAVKAFTSSPELYIKDIRHAGVSVLRDPLRLGTAIGDAVLEVTVAYDGGSADITVGRNDGSAVPQAYVAIIPTTITTEPAMAVALVLGQADQAGRYTSGTLSPGKYYVLATDEKIIETYEGLNKLWNAKLSKGTVIEITSRQVSQSTIEPVKLE